MLTDTQQLVTKLVTELRDEARREFHEASKGDAPLQIRTAGVYAFALYADLALHGQSLTFDEDLVQHRHCEPTNPDFFQHLHAIDALLVAVASLA